MDLATPGTDLRPLFDLLIEHTPAPVYEPGHPLQLLVTNLSANDYVGRMAVGRVWNGNIKIGQKMVIVRQEDEDTAGSIEPGRIVTLSGTVTTLRTAHGIEQIDIEEAAPGDIVSLAGIPDVTIGDTITDPADPRPMARLEMDEPTLSMTFGANTSPLSGRVRPMMFFNNTLLPPPLRPMMTTDSPFSIRKLTPSRMEWVPKLFFRSRTSIIACGRSGPTPA